MPRRCRDRPSPQAGALSFACVQLFAAIIMAAGVIERYGRRPLLLTSSVGATLSLAAMAKASQLGAGASARVAFFWIAKWVLALRGGVLGRSRTIRGAAAAPPRRRLPRTGRRDPRSADVPAGLHGISTWHPAASPRPAPTEYPRGTPAAGPRPVPLGTSTWHPAAGLRPAPTEYPRGTPAAGPRPALDGGAATKNVAPRTSRRDPATPLTGWTALACVDAFIAFVTLGLSTLSWVYAAEVFPDAIRGRAMALATFVFWGWTFACIELYDAAAARLSVPGVLGLFSGFCFLDAARPPSGKRKPVGPGVAPAFKRTTAARRRSGDGSRRRRGVPRGYSKGNRSRPRRGVPRGYSQGTGRADAAAATWIFRGGGNSERRPPFWLIRAALDCGHRTIHVASRGGAATRPRPIHGGTPRRCRDPSTDHPRGTSILTANILWDGARTAEIGSTPAV